MGMARYFVINRTGKWFVTLDGAHLAACDTRGQALGKAAGMANLMGKMGHDADVMIEQGDGLNLAWTHGVDPYPIGARPS